MWKKSIAIVASLIGMYGVSYYALEHREEFYSIRCALCGRSGPSGTRRLYDVLAEPGRSFERLMKWNQTKLRLLGDWKGSGVVIRIYDDLSAQIVEGTVRGVSPTWRFAKAGIGNNEFLYASGKDLCAMRFTKSADLADGEYNVLFIGKETIVLRKLKR